MGLLSNGPIPDPPRLLTPITLWGRKVSFQTAAKWLEFDENATICAVIERPDHPCGDVLLSVNFQYRVVRDRMRSTRGLQSEMIIGSRAQTRYGAQVGQPSRKWQQRFLGGGAGAEGKPVTLRRYARPPRSWLYETRWVSCDIYRL